MTQPVTETDQPERPGVDLADGTVVEESHWFTQQPFSAAVGPIRSVDALPSLEEIAATLVVALADAPQHRQSQPLVEIRLDRGQAEHLALALGWIHTPTANPP